MGGITGSQMHRFELKSRPGRSTNYPLLIKPLLRLWCSTLGQHWDAITMFGLFAVIAMLVFYALEDRSPWYVLAFAGACALASIYGFLQGAWPFGIIEANLHTYCRSPLASENALVDDPHSPGGAGSVMARRPARSLRLSSWTRRQTGRCLPRRRCRNSRSNTRPHRCGTPSPRRPSSRLCSG